MVSRSSSTLLGRLRRDKRGSTLAIMACSMIPLIAMIGSGLDMTRAYMAQNRFRQACDAGSLAGRRMLTGLTVSQAVRDEATKYFTFNYPQGNFQSAPYSLTMSVPTAGTLKIDSETTVPTTLMKIFGYQTLPVTASCSATQDFVNTDIMLVFDLSGSMNCAPGGAGDCGGSEQTGSKIAALREAATSLYDTLEPAQTQLYQNNLRLRYGFVNYNSSVNVGRILYQRNPNWLVQNWTYQSRTPNFVDGTTFLNGKSACNSAYTRDSEVSQFDASWTGVAGGWWLKSNRCSVIIETTSNNEGYSYGQRTLDVRQHLASNLSATETKTEVPIWQLIGTNRKVPETPYVRDDLPYERKSIWNGCIEERNTNAAAIDGGTSRLRTR
ncbi:TadE/TadG family type IV pilus assembly protein [Sphingomonas sp. TZW2008]|uniref:TadE/TadG family type IV pilus assembly protein n=1 Tax=Sphingomonas sp. TZW2008 TaxID=1917973 RepID=UPI00211A911A|nr:Tad domain-containing protein [Sphingomonas sp. TZW2008]